MYNQGGSEREKALLGRDPPRAYCEVVCIICGKRFWVDLLITVPGTVTQCPGCGETVTILRYLRISRGKEREGNGKGNEA